MAARRGILFVIAGPSGVGKGTLVRAVRSRIPEGVELSTSATTRPRREGEVDGRDYVFVDRLTFERMAADGEFLEWAEVFDNLYGTPGSFVDAHLRDGDDVLLEIDVRGAAQVRERAPDAVLILLRPPSLEELARRLRSRGTESEDWIERRLGEAERELAQASWFDYEVVNDDLERASSQVAAIIEAARGGSSHGMPPGSEDAAPDPTEDPSE
ncbi:MAG: guanylate kinase [Actinomycetota bacterium]